MSDELDVVVVGGGAAGLCCAASALAEGLSAKLICETPEVGWSLRPVIVGNSRGFVQHPIWQPNLGGGSWYNAARFLNADVKFHLSPPLHLFNKDTKQTLELSYAPSATAIAGLFAQIAPMPIDEQRPGMERILETALMMSHEELASMDQTLFSAWIAKQGADPILTMILCVLAASISETTPQIAMERLSVFGVITMLRGLVCGESPTTAPVPDPWEGLMIPLAKGLEAKGCEVKRSARVADVIVEDGGAVGVALKSGEDVRARAVALATGLPRIPKIMSSMPAEVRAVVDYAEDAKGYDCCTYCLLDQDVVPLKNITMVTDATGTAHGYIFPMREAAPGTVEDGKWLIAAQALFTPQAYEEIGGHDGAVRKLLSLQEELYPGFEAATVARATQVHPYGFINGIICGPKLPEESSEIPGLYFAGEGSSPTNGFGVEGAGQAGTQRARRIASDLKAQASLSATG
jgi:glycine/D-amino acid oxidase-like deaminating enzyme